MTRSRLYPLDLPPACSGMTIGLYGGSFNPAHAGHRHVAVTALKHLQLDRVWCLVTPGNPLKDTKDLPSLATRLEGTARMMDHPRIDVTGAEERANTRFTAETLDWIHQRTSGIRFVWIMGADNLPQFHLWQRWQSILESIPVAIIDRPGHSLSALSSPAALSYGWARVPSDQIAFLPDHPCPAWSFLHGPRCNLSSTYLRSNPATQPKEIGQKP
ncbi:nicotinate-nucleotide adenylyltransferase [uncultured Cohaesibacter sp.]|uniref:nicotinate-nucleotide adenylyltransferase n=1 Tax=uncultured Cohaesibacter sp. TaxID=1002546 RepID=UPI0029C74BA8|nr:nicotinate-nucleotide adenylyltransferase [uncultured Cohaesibacter sp.]